MEEVAEIVVRAGVDGSEHRSHDGVVALDVLVGVVALLAEELGCDRTDRDADECHAIFSAPGFVTPGSPG